MFKVTYTYDSPSNAGPFKGHTITQTKFNKGDYIQAPFGRATVVSCRLIKTA